MFPAFIYFVKFSCFEIHKQSVIVKLGISVFTRNLIERYEGVYLK